MSKDIWSTILREARLISGEEERLRVLINETILNQEDLGACLAYRLAWKFGDGSISVLGCHQLFLEIVAADPSIALSAAADLHAIRERDPATPNLVIPLLYFKGYLALQASRISHHLWTSGRHTLASHLQSRCSEVFGVDIHPGARFGKGIFLDHATGFVAGETAVIGDNVSILHEVTLGGSGKQCGDRHPKVGNGVLIGAGAKLLGNIRIGDGAKIGAGSVVLEDVEAHTTVVGVPARQVGRERHRMPARFMDHGLACDEAAELEGE